MQKRQKILWWLWRRLQNMNLVSLHCYTFWESRPCDENWGLLVSSRWGVGHPGFAWKLDISSRIGLHDSNDDRVHCHIHFRFDKIFETMNPSYIHNQYSLAHAQIDWKTTITSKSFQAKPSSRTNLAFLSPSFGRSIYTCTAHHDELLASTLCLPFTKLRTQNWMPNTVETHAHSVLP